MSVRIVDYTTELRKDFEALNREWLEKYFTVEPVDLPYFADPEGTILQKGGSIFFAELDGQIVGTCALLDEEEPLELARMAVTASAQGKGIGELLVREAIRRARARGERRLRLNTNSKLVPAVTLYKKLGFKIILEGRHPKYQRPNMIMELDLD
jgi:GNAT superfamily N-acetyltransferase